MRRARRAARTAAVTAVLFACSVAVSAQGSSPASLDPKPIVVSGSIRSRLEASDWFGDDQDGEDLFSGTLARLSVGQSRPRVDWQLELAVPLLAGLPDRANRPAPQGALGLGPLYFAANDNRTATASIFPKQAFLVVKRLGGIEGHTLKLGRMEFVDGAEVAPRHPVLATLKRDRIAHRLLGTFIFSHVGRSLDGAQYVLDRSWLNVTALAARPTRGVFQVDGWGQLDVTVMYGTVTGQVNGGAHAAEWRLFGLGYVDSRSGVVKTDSRPLDLRRADDSSITLGTLGGHYLHTATTPFGSIDLLGWGALQNGSWGALDHRAAAYSTEIGWQPSIWHAAAPWLRGGFSYGSGDSDPNDGTHGTFFQVLPTPRIYARFPFYNMMNTRDAFVEVRLRPTSRLTVRADVHSLRLSDSRDLWYQGGGAFQPSTFGYAGRPSNGHRSLATLYDVSGDIAIRPQASIGLYASYASGRDITRSIFDGTRPAVFGYAELLLRF